MGDQRHNHERLDVWRRANLLAIEVTLAMRRVPWSDRVPALEQLARSIGSIPANIAEGSGENTDGQFVLYIGHALGSVAESRSHLAFLHGVGILPKASILRWQSELRQFTWMLYALRRRHQPDPEGPGRKSRRAKLPPPTLSRLPSPVSSLQSPVPHPLPSPVSRLQS